MLSLVTANIRLRDAIKVLLWHCSDVSKMMDGNGLNTFHTFIISGKANMLRCLLGRVRPAELLNRADKNDDTPLHLFPRNASPRKVTWMRGIFPNS